MALEGYSLLLPHDAAITSGTVLDHYYTGSDIAFHFPYEGFEWLPLLPPTWIYCLVGLLCVAGVTMAIGLWYRLSAVAVFSVWAYLFAVESTRTYWQSHFYLELLLCFLLIWMPAAQRYSIDALRRGNTEQPRTIPFWPVFLLRGQLVITYFYAGIAKFHADWFLDAVPVRWFITDPNVTAPYERFLTPAQLERLTDFLHKPELAYFLSYTGAVFDVCVGFLLLFRRTRIFGLVLMLVFHATNHLLIFDDIGWFPIVGAATALIFLDPDWPERVWRWAKNPRWAKPDAVWTVVGGIVFPLVGATLGWRLKPTPRDSGKQVPFSLGKCVIPFVVGWLIWQALLPIRHHFIASDARFTYEGFSFSWRLKADTRVTFGHSLMIVDSKILTPHPEARATIDWSEWRDDPVLFRRVQPGRVVWPAIPEIAIVLEPVFGERVVYNPYGLATGQRSYDEAERRVRSIWQSLYGHEPKIVRPLSVSETCAAIIDTCEKKRVAEGERKELGQLLPSVREFERGHATSKEASSTLIKVQLAFRELLKRSDAADMVRPVMRQMYPLALHGEKRRPADFFIIEDPSLMTVAADGRTQVKRTAWKHNDSTRQPGIPYDYYLGPQPLIVYMAAIGADEKQLLPLAYITDVHRNDKVLPRIRWNSVRDTNPSKFMHISGQAFYLRRYARRVASIWEEKYGRRPKIQAVTSVSYNGRPRQELVDPNADLARVPVSWFRHNEWVRDLEMPRIPRDALTRQGTAYKRPP